MMIRYGRQDRNWYEEVKIKLQALRNFTLWTLMFLNKYTSFTSALCEEVKKTSDFGGISNFQN